jgi:hypothetical protein
MFAYNAVVAQLKDSSVLHDWLSLGSLVSLPATYGLLVATPTWSTEVFMYTYGLIFVVLLAVRHLNRFYKREPLAFVYLGSLCATLILSYVVSPTHGIVVSALASLFLVYIERLENTTFFGYVATLPFLAIFLHPDADALLYSLAIVLFSLLNTALVIYRRRLYDAILAVAGVLILPWVYLLDVLQWTNSRIVWTYLTLSLVLIGLRWYVGTRERYRSIVPALQMGYLSSLILGLVFSVDVSWQVLAISLFCTGLLFTAISYIESTPWVIVLAFLCGYGSILRLTSGLDVGLTYTVLTLIALSQLSYWVLVLSKLDTKRAEYARSVQLFVASIIPLIGLGNPTRVIYPVALGCMAAMLTREMWHKGQDQREIALMVFHASILWGLFAVGVRELQVFTQSTALVIALFALWRRRMEDVPSIINRYLWVAVLMFTSPMVLQAILSSDSLYSYLLLFEQTLLIVVSVIFKRATFAWFGIAVLVGSVLYQLRQLRYAALAFLGIFVISLAVYFLLRYNRPDQPKN